MELHDALHGFRAGRGTGTATLEANLAQHLAWITYEPLFRVFLDVRKAYNSLGRGQYMEIIWGYGVGINMYRLFHCDWYRQHIIPKAGIFFGNAFFK